MRYRIALRTLFIVGFLIANHLFDGGIFDVVMQMGPFGGQLRAQANLSYVGGVRVASQYSYGYGAVSGANIAIGNSATGTQTVTVCPAVRTTSDGRQVALFSTSAPVSFDTGTASAETVTPTAVSILPVGAVQGQGADQSCAAITGSFSFTHFQSQFVGQVRSGSFGLQEAIDDAASVGPSGASGGAGGVVVIDNTWGGTNATITAAVVYPQVFIRDERGGAEQFWVPQSGATVLATPATLTAVTALPSATPVGAFGTGTYHMCVAYVDINGQEGTCSADFSQAGLATGSFIFTAPVASTGAVGYTIYIGLTAGGVTNLDYKVPLVTQPTVIGAYPVSNGVCRLTTVETVTPACAVANAVYGQSAATATVSVITLNTSQINPQSTIISTTSIYVPNPGGRTTYLYVPGSHIGTPGVPAAELAFPITAAAATAVPAVLGTINIPPEFMNYVGRTIEVCGTAYGAGATTASIENIQFQWDANGQNTAGAGVKIGDLNMTLTGTLHYAFCADFQTTVASASATGGSIISNGGYLTGSAASQGVSGAGASIMTATTGSLNLADAARINIIYLHVTGTDGAGVTLQGLTAKVIN